MEKRTLGKIISAEFGQCPDRPFLFGLQLQFAFGASRVSDGGKYLVNLSEGCQWDSEQQRLSIISQKMEHLNEVLTAAKVHHVSQLVGKPVEVTINDNAFKDFRVLTEVI